MKLAPVATISIGPAVLPVFDDGWKARCMACANYRTGGDKPTTAKMLCTEAQSRGGRGLASCGDARGTHGACGPTAMLWRARGG